MSAWLARRDRAELLGVAIVAGFLFLSSAAPLAFSVLVSPEAIERGDVRITPPCPMAARGGCATCGMTRGFSAMSRLRVGDAHAYNPGAPWLWLLAVTTFAGSGAALARVHVEARRRPRALEGAMLGS